MVSIEVISQKVQLAEAFFNSLVQANIVLLKNNECQKNESKVTCLNRLIRSLKWDIAGDYNTLTTQAIYKLLIGQIVSYTGSIIPYDPNVVIPGMVVVIEPGDIMQTAVVFPGDGVSSYTFSELIGQTVLSVYRGTGTVLRARSGVANNEYAQFNVATGAITVSYAFADGESLWVEYKTT